ncbi:MAG: FecR domain-containing protein, partial [Planctomycetes bacterium]|nr:FecR domain-containing protein [Planctomycetota bacterium]
MRCPDLESWTAFYGGETSERETERLSDHLQDCERCRREFDQLCGLGAAMRGALVRRPRAVRPSRPSAVPLAIAAAFALAAVAVLVYPKEKPGPTPVTIAQTPITIVEAPATPAPPPPLPAPRLPEAPTAARPELTPRPALPAPEIPAPTPVEAETPAPPVEAPVKVEPAATRVVEKSEAVAALERIEGEVVVTGPAGRVPARSNQPLEAGSGLSASGARSRAVVRFADGTRVELGEKTVVAQISDRAGAKGVGKWIEVSEGTVTVDAAHQPADRALILATPQGEARVVGTVFRLVVDPAATRLEVLEGKVRLSRPGAAVDVHGGFGATA